MVSSRWDYLLQQTNIDIQTLARLVEGCNLPRGCFAWSMSVCRLVRWFGPTGCNGYQSCVSRPLGGCSWWNNIAWFLDVLSTSIRSRNVLFALFSTNMFTQTDTHTHQPLLHRPGHRGVWALRPQTGLADKSGRAVQSWRPGRTTWLKS